MDTQTTPLIFAKSIPQRITRSVLPKLNAASVAEAVDDLDTSLLRKLAPGLPEMAERHVVQHFTTLSQQNFSVDTHFYPLGSCTMKYNPRILQLLAREPMIAQHHPLTSIKHSQGLLRILYETQELLMHITGMHAVSLTPMAGAQGELAGVLMIRAYHADHNGSARDEMLVADSAHGTNPASAVMCGYTVREVPTAQDGNIDLAALEQMVSERTAGIMLTNPSTLGVFDTQIAEVARIVHKVGGLLYYDGANLNAILGKVRPADMGFDVMHMNLHKTFATPHGGGGPGSGPVAANARLAPYLPVPMVGYDRNTQQYYLLHKRNIPQSIGRLSTFMGNVGVILRAFGYIRLLGREGLPRVAQHATLNANYLAKKLAQSGFTLAYPQRLASHEFIISLQPEKVKYGITALDFAKRLLDYNIHAPTIYFPLLVPECLLIEPTETESKADLDDFIMVMNKIKQEAIEQPELLKQAPLTLKNSRFDETKAARELDLRFTVADPTVGK